MTSPNGWILAKAAGCKPLVNDVSTGAKPPDCTPARRSLRLRAFPLIAALLMCLAVVAAAWAGIQRNLHAGLADHTWGRAQFAITSALSSRYHGAYGYTAFNVTRTILTYAGLTGEPAALAALGSTFPKNLRDRSLIEAAIAKAAKFEAPYNPEQELSGSSGEDVGLVDYVRLAFRLFGNNLPAFFWTYIALVSVSLAAALVAFRRMPGLLTVFVLYALALPVLFTSDLFDFANVGVLDPRFLSTLSIIPAAHIALTVLAWPRPSVEQIALVLLQSAILIFGYWIRTSALWTVLGLSLFAALLVGQALWQRRSLQLARNWPLAILGVLMVAHLVYVAHALHPVYQQANERPHHALWHAFIYALAGHPDWGKKYAAQYGVGGDTVPENVAKAYVLAHPPEDPDAVYLTKDRTYLRIGVTERYKRKAFLEFFANDPKFVLEAFFIYNVKRCNKAFIEYLSTLKAVPVAGWVLLAIALMMIATLLALDRREQLRALQGVLIVFGGFLFSILPIMITAPSLQVMADQFLMLTVSVLGWAVVAISHVMLPVIPTERLDS